MLLPTLPAHSLRAIATYLGLRQRGQSRKDEWIAAIQTHWYSPATQAVAVARLPSAAKVAYHHLHMAEKLPAALFWNEYGSLRLPGDEEFTKPPWQAPETISELLYYSGLLYPLGHRQIRKAAWLTSPSDLPIDVAVMTDPFVAAPLIDSTAPTAPVNEQTIATSPILPDVWPLLHDVAQYLIYRHQHPHLPLLHGHWLTPTHCQALNQRLLQPDRVPLPRSHKGAPMLSFLTFLTTAGGLADATGITAVGWQWLDEPPALQLQRLWQGWVQAPVALRERHAHAAVLPPPWPQPLLRWLGQQAGTLSARQAASKLLGNEELLADFFVAHLDAAADLAQLLAPLFAFDLCLFGILAPVGAEEGAPLSAYRGTAQTSYRLTTIGDWLLHPLHSVPSIRPRTTDTAADSANLGVLLLAPPCTILVPPTLDFTKQACLAAYTDYATTAAMEQRDQEQQRICHGYVLSTASLARAAAENQPLAPLIDLLHELGYMLDHVQMTWLQTAYATGRALQLHYLPLLRTDSVAHMAELQRDPRLDGLWGALLGPTTVTLRASLHAIADDLRAAGYAVSAPSEPLAAAGADYADGPRWHSAGLLWLAGRLYQTLGEQLPSLPPLRNTVLDQLRQQLSPQEQAVVQSQFEHYAAQLAQIFDGYHLLPPMIPELYEVDTAAIAQQIEGAIAANEALSIHYYTASRNLLTERRIEPYWIEERHGRRYLRAYCHSAGHVLTFRLDRIHSAAVVVNTT